MLSDRIRGLHCEGQEIRDGMSVPYLVSDERLSLE